MKTFYFISSKIRGLFSTSQSSDLSLDCRLTVGSPSFDCRSVMLKLVSVLVLVLTVGIGQMWATSYTITFNQGSSGSTGTEASTSTNASTLINSGSSNVTGKLATATKVYYTSQYYLKLGTSSAAGCVKFSLVAASQLTNPTIIVKARRWNSGTAAKISANGATAIQIPNTSNYYYFAFPISGKISYIQIDATKYVGVESVTVTDECNAIDVTGGSTVTLPLGSTTYNAYDWSKAGAPWAQAAAASYPISSNYYCTSFTQTNDAGNANGLTCKASTGVVSLSGITSNCGVDVSVAVSGTNNFTVSLTGAAANVTGNNKTLSISTTSTTATLTISKTTSSDGYIKYIQIAPRTPCCTELASLNGSVSWSSGSATVSWDAAGGCGSWGLKYKKHADSDIPANWTSYDGSFGTADSRTSNSTAISGLDAGVNYDFKITGTSDGSVYCSGTVTETKSSTVPKITASSSMTDLGYAQGETPESQSFTISGTQLTGNLTVTAPSNFLVSLDGSSWSDAGGSKTVTVSTPPSNLGTTTIYVKAASGLSEGDDPSGNVTISGGGAASVNVAVAATITEPCTAPNHVDVSGTYRYTPGETISLTATAYSSAGTGSPISSGSITAYKWQKYTGSWTDINPATNASAATANLQIASCATTDGGQYRCVIYTGSSCSTASDGYNVRVWTLEGNYSGSSFTSNNITWTDATTGTVTLTLNANSTYEFKVYGNGDGKYYGCNTGIAKDASSWKFDTGTSNCALSTGKYSGGKYTFTIDITHADDNYVNVSVAYPKKTTYVELCSDWKAGTAKYAIYYWNGEDNGWTDFMATYDCNSDIRYADVPVWATKCIVGRFNPSKSATGNWDDMYNQTGDLTLPTDGKDYYHTLSKGGDEKYYGSWGTFVHPTYDVTFAKNGADGGSDMSDVDDIACMGSTTLVANTWTKTGYTFTHWTANVDVTANGSAVSAGGVIPNQAELTDISSDITLTAVWAANHTLSYNMNGGDGTSCDGTTTYYTGQSFTTCSGAGNKTGNTFNNWLGSNSTSYAASTTYTMPDANLTLTAQWTPIDYTVTMAQSPSVGSTLTGGTTTAHYGGTINISATEPDGYVFDKWTSSDGITFADATSTSTSFTMPAKNVTVTANFKKIHTVTWHVNGSSYSTGVVDGNTYVVDGNKISDVPTAPANNTLNNCANKFMGWSTTNITKGSSVTDDDDIEALALFTDKAGSPEISANTDFYAVFAEGDDGTGSLTQSEIASFYCAGGGGCSATNSYGSYTVSSDDGNWSGVCCSATTGGVSPIYSVNIKSGTMKVGGKDVSYHLESPTYSGSITNISITGTHGGASARTLYICSGETASPSTSNLGTISVASGNTSAQGVVPSSSVTSFYIYASDAIQIRNITVSYGSAENYVTQCADNQVRVTYDFNGGTGDACTEGVTTKSASYTVCSTEPEKDYYTFAGWNDGTNTYDAGDTYNLQENTTFTAQWTPMVYTIKYNLNGGTQQESPDPATSYTVESSDITLPTPTYGHKRFDGWFENSDLSTGGVKTTIAAGSHENKEYWAKWTDRHTIVFDADGSETTIYRASDEALNASLAGQGSVPDDPDASGTCSSKVFMGWTETEIYDYTNSAPADLMNTYTGTVSADKHYYAVWATRSGSVGSYTYSAYATTCCDNHVTLSSPSITGSGTVVFAPVSPAEASPDGTYATCRNDISVTATVTPASGYSCTALSFTRSDSEDVDIDPTISGNLPSAPSAQDFVLSFDKNTDVTVTTAATFTAKGVTGWTWKQATVEEQIDIPATVDLYIGQEAWFDLISFTPSDVISDYKGYTTTYNSDDLAQGGKGATRYKIRAKVAKSSMSLTLTSDNNGSVQEVITIRGTALPTATFVDNIHNKTDFTTGDAALPASGILSATIDGTDKRIVYLTQKTPNHADVAEPGSGNACEKSHLHLVGWIDKDWADEHPNATHSEILGAGTGVYYAANTDIDLSAKNGKTFLAVWSKIE